MPGKTGQQSGGEHRNGEQAKKKAAAAAKPGMSSRGGNARANRSAVSGGKARSAREAALETLTRIETGQAYSNLLLNRVLQSADLDRKESALATELVYGTVQRKNTIDYFLNRFLPKGVEKLEPWVRNLLRLSFYQLYYLDRIPEHAAVSEAVNIAKRKGHAGISGLVNGVLRNVIRRKDELTVPAGLEAAARMALEHSHPEWLVAAWIRRFGEETAERICRANNEPPRTAIRVNRRKLSRGELLEQLRAEGIEAYPSKLSDAGLIVESGGNMAFLPAYRNGLFSIQDESSMLVAELLDVRPGMRVLDCCAAPGGKTAHIAELMDDAGQIIACDIHEHKRKLVAEQAERLGLRSIETVTADALELPEMFAGQTFDRILLDAPCSGLGVIRRKPDIKWTKKPEEIESIAKLQYKLLERVSKLLAPGGLLVYSTCTVTEEENELVIGKFLRNFSGFAPADPPERLRQPDAMAGTVTILPHQFGSDGFFIARLTRTT
jgi:16S rRNA (cytosine967-C5)-methyltransferase